MISISHMPSPRSLSNSFHRCFNLLILHSGVLNNSYGISRLHSKHLETGEVFLLNLGPFSQELRFYLHAFLIIVPFEEFFYTHPKHFMNSFLCVLRRPSFQHISSLSVFNFVLQIFFIDASSFVSIFLWWFFRDYSSVVIVSIHLFFS